LVKFEASINSQGKVYLPSEIRREPGVQLEILANTKAIVLFSRGMRAADILRSLEVIDLDLKHRAELESKKVPRVLGIRDLLD